MYKYLCTRQDDLRVLIYPLSAQERTLQHHISDLFSFHTHIPPLFGKNELHIYLACQGRQLKWEGTILLTESNRGKNLGLLEMLGTVVTAKRQKSMRRTLESLYKFQLHDLLTSKQWLFRKGLQESYRKQHKAVGSRLETEQRLQQGLPCMERHNFKSTKYQATSCHLSMSFHCFLMNWENEGKGVNNQEAICLVQFSCPTKLEMEVKKNACGLQ